MEIPHVQAGLGPPNSDTFLAGPIPAPPTQCASTTMSKTDGLLTSLRISRRRRTRVQGRTPACWTRRIASPTTWARFAQSKTTIPLQRRTYDSGPRRTRESAPENRPNRLFNGIDSLPDHGQFPTTVIGRPAYREMESSERGDRTVLHRVRPTRINTTRTVKILKPLDRGRPGSGKPSSESLYPSERKNRKVLLVRLGPIPNTRNRNLRTPGACTKASTWKAVYRKRLRLQDKYWTESIPSTIQPGDRPGNDHFPTSSNTNSLDRPGNVLVRTHRRMRTELTWKKSTTPFKDLSEKGIYDERGRPLEYYGHDGSERLIENSFGHKRSDIRGTTWNATLRVADNRDPKERGSRDRRPWPQILAGPRDAVRIRRVDEWLQSPLYPSTTDGRGTVAFLRIRPRWKATPKRSTSGKPHWPGHREYSPDTLETTDVHIRDQRMLGENRTYTRTAESTSDDGRREPSRIGIFPTTRIPTATSVLLDGFGRR